jgi:hypothetical protein
MRWRSGNNDMTADLLERDEYLSALAEPPH